MSNSDVTAVLKDGTHCEIRLCCDDNGGAHDAESVKSGIRSAWCHLSPESRYSRFASGIRQLSDKQLDYLADLDNMHRLAWCAFIHGDSEAAGIGIARFVRLKEEPDVAEFAITVIDEYQGSGLGTLLLKRLIDSARRLKLRVLRGYVLPSNKPMIALAEKYGGISRSEDTWRRIDIPVYSERDVDSEDSIRT